jgi:hypothetical protein
MLQFQYFGYSSWGWLVQKALRIYYFYEIPEKIPNNLVLYVFSEWEYVCEGIRYIMCSVVCDKYSSGITK